MNNSNATVKRMSMDGARHVTTLLLDSSQWFCVEPLPMDNAYVAVKDENAHVVAAAANDYPPNPETDDKAES